MSQRLANNEKYNTQKAQEVFYSREWRKSGITLVKSGKPIDILIDDSYLYLIEVPENRTASTISTAVGYHLFSTLGALAGASFGESYDEESRAAIRANWVNQNDELISDSFKQYVVLQAPLHKLASAVSFNLLGVTIRYNNRKITLSRRRKRPLIGRSKQKDRELADYLRKVTDKNFQATFEIPLSAWGFVFLFMGMVITFVYFTM